MNPVIKWLRILHRDLGYLAVGLTIIFSVSGIAVNHIEDWNPNYSKEIKYLPLINFDRADAETEMVQKVLKQADIPLSAYRSTFQPNRETLNIYTDDGELQINLTSGMLRWESIGKRFLLFDFNFLHLNWGRDAWKWFSDAFAIVLIFLALSGLFLIKGRKGFKWRGAVLSLIGILLPVLLMIYYRI